MGNLAQHESDRALWALHREGAPILWIQRSSDPKQGLKWRKHDGCKAKSRPVASKDRFFCVIPPGSGDCRYTFLTNKKTFEYFAFRDDGEMVYQTYNNHAAGHRVPILRRYKYSHFSKQ